ncbi:TIGR03617 family F420-dependent LLM class oxidoreductase [Mycolicibacterium sp. XJ1819]
MLVDAKLTWSSPPTFAHFTDRGREAERAGYAGLWSAESAHDPFLPLGAVAQTTEHLQIGTSIAVAFARNPMSLAQTALDLHVLSGGRFMLGLGSQVKAHIERRFSMPWSRPAARMSEFVEAMQAIWSAWQNEERLDFRGDFYSHTLMTPFFSPGTSPFGAPPVYLAAVGEAMTEVAGRVCDGLMPHPFTTLRYWRERTLPALQRGLDASGRSLQNFSISFQGLVASGRTEEQMAEAVRRVREQIAFYASTPAYHSVLELHGWSDLGTDLNELSRSDFPDRWTRMGDLIDDEMLTAFAVVAEPDDVGTAVAQRYAGLVDRFTFYAPYPHDPVMWEPAIDDIRNAHPHHTSHDER